MKVDFKNMKKQLEAHLECLETYKNKIYDEDDYCNIPDFEALRDCEKNEIIKELFQSGMWELLKTFTILEEENKLEKITND